MVGVHMGFVGVGCECVPDVVEPLVGPVGVEAACGSFEEHHAESGRRTAARSKSASASNLKPR